MLAGRGVSCISVMHLYSETTSIILEIKIKPFLMGEKTKNKTKPHKQTKPLKHQTNNKVSSSPNSATSSKQKYSATSYSEWFGVPVSAVQLGSRNNAVLWRLGSSFISVFLSPGNMQFEVTVSL